MRSSINRHPPAFQPGFDFMPPASHSERRYRIARELATDEAGLLDQARAALKAYDEAVRSAEDEEAGAQRERLEAIADKIEAIIPLGDGDEETGLQRLLAAKPGQVPMWGQAGGFLVSIGKCRIVIRTDGESMSASAFDWDRPFLSRNGYQELYGHGDDARGRSVKQVAVLRIRNRNNNGGKLKLVPISQSKWVYDPDTDTNARQEVEPGPDEEDTDWQPGGWLYELKKQG